MNSRILCACLAVLAGAAASAALAAERLMVIGTSRLDPSATGAAVDISGARGAYRGIRVRSLYGIAEITRVQVYYDDGTIHDEDRTIRLKSGERSRPIGANGSDRFIDSVRIATAEGSNATLEILGIQTDSGARMARSGPVSGEIAGATTDSGPDPSAPGALMDGDDVMFGYQNVGFGIDRDVIQVGGDVGKFDRIRLRVLGNDIHIKTLTVVYVDGEKEDIAIDADIKANTRTDWLDLKGSRFIREIALLYRSRPSMRGRARIEVTGQLAKGWLGADGEGRKYNEGWVLLGAQTAGFTGFDRDTIKVGENEGGFSRLRVVVKDRAITLREVRIKYFSGPDDVFAMKERVDPGKPYGPLEFKGGRAPIKIIEARYRSRYDILKGLGNALDGTPAVVEFWGQH